MDLSVDQNSASNKMSESNYFEEVINSGSDLAHLKLYWSLISEVPVRKTNDYKPSFKRRALTSLTSYQLNGFW